MADPSSEVLLGQLRKGDQIAAKAVFQRFANRLVMLAKVRLDVRIRQKVDPEDIVQSVFRSFFARSERGEFDFGNWQGIWALLVLLTLRKCSRRAVHFQADRRDVRREVAWGEGVSGSDKTLLEAIADEPTPEEANILTETAETVMEKLKGIKERKIFELSLQGYSIQEISAMVGHYERGVERVRKKIKLIIEELIDKT